MLESYLRRPCYICVCGLFSCSLTTWCDTRACSLLSPPYDCTRRYAFEAISSLREDDGQFSRLVDEIGAETVETVDDDSSSVCSSSDNESNNHGRGADNGDGETKEGGGEGIRSIASAPARPLVGEFSVNSTVRALEHPGSSDDPLASGSPGASVGEVPSASMSDGSGGQDFPQLPRVDSAVTFANAYAAANPSLRGEEDSETTDNTGGLKRVNSVVAMASSAKKVAKTIWASMKTQVKSGNLVKRVNAAENNTSSTHMQRVVARNYDALSWVLRECLSAASVVGGNFSQRDVVSIIPPVTKEHVIGGMPGGFSGCFAALESSGFIVRSARPRVGPAGGAEATVEAREIVAEKPTLSKKESKAAAKVAAKAAAKAAKVAKVARKAAAKAAKAEAKTGGGYGVAEASEAVVVESTGASATARAPIDGAKDTTGAIVALDAEQCPPEDGKSTGDEHYVFKHDFVRSAIYQLCPASRRKEWHRAIAELYEGHNVTRGEEVYQPDVLLHRELTHVDQMPLLYSLLTIKWEEKRGGERENYTS